MADIIALFPGTAAEQSCYRDVASLGSEAGMGVRILCRISRPHDLLVVIDGTPHGCTTVAALPADEMAVAEIIAHSTLATLGAARSTWATKPPATRSAASNTGKTPRAVQPRSSAGSSLQRETAR